MDLGKEKISTLLKAFTIPCIISMLVTSFYNIVDQVFIGWGIGYLGNGATSVVYPIVVIASAICYMIADGAAAFLSLNLGEKDFKEAKKGVGATIYVLIVSSIILTIICSIFLPQLISLFGCTKNIYPYAMKYGRIIILGFPFLMIGAGLSSLIRADGNPRYSMMSNIIGAVTNIVLDALFIFVFKMGVTGAAIATVIAQIIAFLVCLKYILNFKSFKIELSDIKYDKSVLKVISYGISTCITQLAIVIVMLVINNTLKKTGEQSIYGADIPLTAFGVVMKVNQIFNGIIIGIAVGAQPIIGFNYGAKRLDRVRETFITSIKICFVVGIAATFVFQVFPEQITSLFGSESALYNEFSVKCFRIYLLLAVCNTFQIACSIFFQSLGKTKKSIICSLSRQILFLVPSILVLSKLFGIEGLLWACPVADLLAFIVTGTLFIYEYKHLKEHRKGINL